MAAVVAALVAAVVAAAIGAVIMECSCGTPWRIYVVKTRNDLPIMVEVSGALHHYSTSRASSGRVRSSS